MKRRKNNGHRNKFFLFNLILLMIVTSCATKKRSIDANAVNHIKFWYIPKSIKTSSDINDCADIVYETLVNRDTVITNRDVINKYVAAINRLKSIKKKADYDLRVSSLISFNGGKKKIAVCVSFNGVVLKDNVLMKSNDSLLQLLDDVLYNHLDMEDWTPDFLKIVPPKN